jgi:type II secretory ATPase GspE/PulE/Tfp pilus assembly ATPase PilB-like protein
VALSPQELWAYVAPDAGWMHPDAEALRYIPAGFAFRNNVLAYAVDGPELLVATPDGEPATVDRIRLLTGMQVRARQLPRDVIRRQLSIAYASSPRAIDELEISSPAIRVVDEIQELAIRACASDVHVEPVEQGGRVRQRVDGKLQIVRTISADIYPQVVSRFKVLAGLDVADRRLPQDGRYTIDDRGYPIDARVSSIATIGGERIVVRLLDSRVTPRTLDSLGMDAGTLQRLRRLTVARQGFVVVCGPTGSGKTTTLYAAIAERQGDDTHICTIEDPVEVRMTGVAQVQVNVKAGMTFARALRAMLRADPDVIMIGEMRDAETARIAVSAALSGTLVLTTLHSADAAHAIERLIDLEIPQHAIAAALTGIVAQRLVRTRCRRCAGKGCDACGKAGFAGRTGIFECVDVNDGAIARQEGISLANDARRHIAARLTTAEEVRRVLGEVALS